MAKRKSKSNAALDSAAQAVGHALGSIAGTIESLQAQHPHPVDEAREALSAGQETVAAVAAKARTRGAAMVKNVNAVARRTKKAVTRARRKSTSAVARATKKVVKRARKTVKRARKTARRAKRRLKR